MDFSSLKKQKKDTSGWPDPQGCAQKPLSPKVEQYISKLINTLSILITSPLKQLQLFSWSFKNSGIKIPGICGKIV